MIKICSILVWSKKPHNFHIDWKCENVSTFNFCLESAASQNDLRAIVGAVVLFCQFQLKKHSTDAN